MTSTNKSFIIRLGLFWMMTSAVMLSTGYWPALMEFGISEKSFQMLARLGFGVGAMALVHGLASIGKKR